MELRARPRTRARDSACVDPTNVIALRYHRGQKMQLRVNRTSLFCRLLVLASAASLPVPSSAQQAPWPNRAVRIIATSPPGGSVDLLARVAAEAFAKDFGRPFVVENRSGANGNIGAELVLKAPPDGHMLFVSPPGPFAINAHLMASMPFDPLRDIAPVALLGVAPLLLVVHPSVPARNLRELISWMRSERGRVNYGSQAVASTGHLAMELFKTLAGVEANHVPYRGSAAQATADLLAGRVAMSFLNTSTTIPYLRTGELRAIAVAEKKRVAAVPDVPTLDESGLPGFEATPWLALGARAGTEPGVIARLNESAARELDRAQVRERLARIGIEPRTMTPEQLAVFVRAESEKWGGIIRRSGARLE
jgi:tripartite-type tricarboxylate transporter receptor subunit TctC